ncbi:MAG: patatin, partial [Glaciihabitans sp.]|nr:patatin [Glaciihabitans sp.]
AGLETSVPHVLAKIRAPGTSYVGTSAGSLVAAMLASGISANELLKPEIESETAVTTTTGAGRSFWGIAKITVVMASSRIGTKSPEAGRRRIGAYAAAAQTGPEDVWIASIAGRLPMRDWPERRLLITAVDVESGQLRVFDRESGVDLASAVAASCSVPGIFPPVTIQGRRYMDGGMRSVANADLAAGSDPVLILVPMREGGPGIGSVSRDELKAFEHSRSHVAYADNESVRAFGRNPLNTTTRAASARAGYKQGQLAGQSVQQLWA